MYNECSQEYNADVAQLVEHHLAKVRVASSNLVIRSQSIWSVYRFGGRKPQSLVEWLSGPKQQPAKL